MEVSKNAKGIVNNSMYFNAHSVGKKHLKLMECRMCLLSELSRTFHLLILGMLIGGSPHLLKMCEIIWTSFLIPDLIV